MSADSGSFSAASAARGRETARKNKMRAKMKKSATPKRKKSDVPF